LILAFSGSGDAHKLAAPVPPSPVTSRVPTSSPRASVASRTPRKSTATPRRTSPAAPSSRGCTKSAANGAGGTVPIRICIPAIGVDAGVMQLGLNTDRTVQVPPLSQVSVAGWYKYSPAPGLLGPSVILGHVDSATAGRGVFFDLGRLHSGDKISMLRADGMIARYRVTRVAQIPKSSFPTAQVYGDTNAAEIRLITCGGQFDASAGSYLDNIIAFGSLVSLRKA
ncbi:MAG: class F sortase, partial [Actinomycetota bacterium]|nr:class F sortase [Actinomycetota bacterium]